MSKILLNLILNQLSVPSVPIPDGATSTDAVFQSTDVVFKMNFDRQDIHMAVIQLLTDSILISQITDLSLLLLFALLLYKRNTHRHISKQLKNNVFYLPGKYHYFFLTNWPCTAVK